MREKGVRFFPPAYRAEFGRLPELTSQWGRLAALVERVEAVFFVAVGHRMLPARQLMRCARESTD